MKNPHITQSFTEDIKREVLMDLNRTYGGRYEEQNLIDSIKQKVLADLGFYQQWQSADPNKVFIESIKNEVLAEMRTQGRSGFQPHINQSYPDRNTIEAIKREVIAQIEMGQEGPEEHYTQEQGRMSEPHYGGQGYPYGTWGKDSIGASTNATNYNPDYR